jgi:vancomycin aglycone glucosyltransferase
VLLSTYDSRGGIEPLALTPGTRARAATVAGAIHTDGATIAATLLVDAISRERPPVPM